MKFISKLDWILDELDFMKSSQSVKDNIEKAKEKKQKKFNGRDRSRIIKNQIKKKVKTPTKIDGVCDCDDNILCSHRKTFIKDMLNG